MLSKTLICRYKTVNSKPYQLTFYAFDLPRLKRVFPHINISHKPCFANLHLYTFSSQKCNDKIFTACTTNHVLIKLRTKTQDKGFH